MMNRQQRKGYLDRMRSNQQASLCPLCMRKTRHFTQPSKDGENKVDIVCEYCEKFVNVGVEGLPPYIAVRITTEGVRPA